MIYQKTVLGRLLLSATLLLTIPALATGAATVAASAPAVVEAEPVLEEKAPLALEEVARRLQATYDQTSGFRARFSQLTTVPMSNRRREGGGTVIFQKPHQMRWEYDYPDHQVLVSDGRQVRLYFAASNQMMLRPVDDHLENDVTYSFFSGSGNLLRDFQVEEVPAAEVRSNGGHQLRLLPRELHPQVEYLDLQVDRQSFLIRRLDIVDHFGSVTTLIFAGIELDPELPPDFNQFDPPEGTEILGQ